MGFLTQSLTARISTEVFSSTSYNAAWSSASDVWVLLNPDVNQWTEAIDWSLGMLLRRALLRLDLSEKKSSAAEVLLLAAPEGMPAPRVLVFPKTRGDDSEWLRDLAPVLSQTRARSATVFAPREWRPPTLKMLTDISQGEWGIRWVEPAG